MKNTLTLIGAVAVAIAVIAAAAIIVKKYMEKTGRAVSKKGSCDCDCDCCSYDDIDPFDTDEEDECFWDEVPVEEDNDDFGFGDDTLPADDKKDGEEAMPF